jgi:cellulose synthase/poly-beta-1,6-N-acetylglucosamine synthase-like glycosyltransferase
LWLILFSAGLCAQTYTLIRKSALRKSRRPYNAAQDNKPKSVSIVIAAHNEAQQFPSLIESLLHQDHSDFEIIIVNDRSTDSSASILEHNGHPRLTIMEVPITAPLVVSPKKRALALGIAEAKNEIIVLTDADCLPASPSWLRLMASPFTAGADLVMGWSPYYQRPGLLNAIIQYETEQTALRFTHAARKGKAYMGLGRNLAFTKALYQKVGGYSAIDHILSGDDDLLVQKCVRAKAKIVVQNEPLAYTISAPVETWADWWHQKRRHSSVSPHYRLVDKFKLALEAFFQLLAWLAPLLLAGYKPIFAVSWLLLWVFSLTLLQRLSLPEKKEWRLNINLALLDFLYIVNLWAYTISGILFRPSGWKRTVNFRKKLKKTFVS